MVTEIQHFEEVSLSIPTVSFRNPMEFLNRERSDDIPIDKAAHVITDIGAIQEWSRSMIQAWEKLRAHLRIQGRL